LKDLVKGGWRLLAGEKQATPRPRVERRSGKRIELRLPAQACLSGGVFHDSTLMDVSPRGLSMETDAGAWAGQPVAVRLSSSVAGVPAFILNGQVVRLIPHTPPGIGVDFSKAVNGREVLACYRQLVLFYLHRRPLLDEVNAGLQARCTACDWRGRAESANAPCPSCGQPLERASRDNS
jgi:hypothetical protein